MFLIDINDICTVSDLLKFVLFADDINNFCSGNSPVELQIILNHELSKLYNYRMWFSVNKLLLNSEKTNYIIFRNRPPDTDENNIPINNIKLPRVQSKKIMGIVIDENMKWKPCCKGKTLKNVVYLV